MRKWRWLVLISLCLWLIDGWGWMNWIKDPVGSWVQPMRVKRYQRQVTGDESGRVELEAGMAIIQAELAAKVEENNRLRELLGAPLDPGLKFIPANIISYKDRQIKIDVGSKGGAKVDQVVMAYVKSEINNGLLLGKVVEVKAGEARVNLIGENNNLKAVTGSGVKGVVTREEDKLILKEVLQKDQLNLGDLVMSFGTDGWVPSLVIGKIAKIDKEETKVFQSAELEWIIDPDYLTQVWLLSL